MQEQCRLISLAEYQKLLSDSMAKDEGVEINAELVHKMHILEKQLDIAVKALEWLDRHSSKYDCSWSIEEQLDNIKAQAQAAVYQIEELDK